MKSRTLFHISPGKYLLLSILCFGLATSGLEASQIGEWFKKRGSTLKRGIQCAFASKKYNCSKQERETARKWLIGSSVAAIVAATAAVGAGVAYQQAQKAKERAKAEEAAEAERQAMQAKKRAALEAEARAAGKTEAEIAKLLQDLGNFNDEPATAAEKQSPTKRYFLSTIDVIKGGPKILKDAFDYVKQQVAKGAIKTKEGIVVAYIKAADFVQNFGSMVKDSLGIQLDRLKKGYEKTKEALTNFRNFIRNPREVIPNWYPSGQSFSSNLGSLVSYLKYLGNMKDAAKEAAQKLDFLQIVHAKTIAPQEYIDKRQEQEAEKAELNIRKRKINNQRAIIATGKIPPELKKKGLLARFRTESEQIVALQKDLQKEEKEINEKLEKLAKKKEILDLQEQFDVFASPKNWANIYFPTLVDRVNALNLKLLGSFSEAAGKAAGSVFAGLEFLHRNGGKIGQVLFPNIERGLKGLKIELEKLGTDVKRLLSIHPIFEITRVTERQVALTALKLIAKDKFQFFKYYGDSLHQAGSKLIAADKRSDALIVQIQELFTWFNNFQKDAIQNVSDELFKNKDIRNAAQQLRNAVIQVVSVGKNSINSIVDGISFITENFKDALVPIGKPGVITIFKEFNNKLREIVGKPLINPKFIDALTAIITIRIPNIDTALKNISAASKKYEVAPGA